MKRRKIDVRPSGLRTRKAKSSSSSRMDCIPMRPARGAKISIVSRAFCACFSGVMARIVLMLCRRSASLTNITRISLAIAIKSLRVFSASFVAVEPSCILVRFVTPSTSIAISGENKEAISCFVDSVSSIVSCKRPVMIEASSSFCLAKITATATGCVK